MKLVTHKVGLGDLKIAQGPALFSALGLGSCIGLVLQDPQKDLAGMVHIVLPEAFPDKPVERLGKFASTAVQALYNALVAKGASPTSIRAAYAGGAQVFKFGNATSDRLDVGARNALAVAKYVKTLNIKVLSHDIGGSNSRTVIFCTQSGELKIRTATTGDTILCNFKKR